jgi:putative intracellular protease/amidase
MSGLHRHRCVSAVLSCTAVFSDAARSDLLGADWVDQEVVVDANLVTSRKPDHIPAFNREIIKLFSQSSRQSL